MEVQLQSLPADASIQMEKDEPETPVSYKPVFCLIAIGGVDITGFTIYGDELKSNNLYIFWFPLLKWILWYLYLSIFVYKSLNIFSGDFFEQFKVNILGLHKDFIAQFKNESFYRHINTIIILSFLNDIILVILLVFFKLPAINPKYFDFEYDEVDLDDIAQVDTDAVDKPIDGHFLVRYVILLIICGIGANSKASVREGLGSDYLELTQSSAMVANNNNNNNNNPSSKFHNDVSGKESSSGQSKDSVNINDEISDELNRQSSGNASGNGSGNGGSNSGRDMDFWLAVGVLAVSQVGKTIVQAVDNYVLYEQANSWYVYAIMVYYMIFDVIIISIGGIFIHAIIKILKNSIKALKTFGTNNSFDFSRSSDCVSFWNQREMLIHYQIPLYAKYPILFINWFLLLTIVLIVFILIVLILYGFQGFLFIYFVVFTPYMILSMYAFQLMTNMFAVQQDQHILLMTKKIVLLEQKATALSDNSNDNSNGNDNGNGDNSNEERAKILNENVRLLKTYIKAIPITDEPLKIDLVLFELPANNITSNTLKGILTTLVVYIVQVYLDDFA